MIITHETLLYSQQKTIFEDLPILMKIPNQLRLSLIFGKEIVIYRAHTNWDDAPGGNNDSLANKLGISITARIPYGRVGTIASTTLEKFANHVKKALNCDHVIVVGNLNREVSKIAVVSGSGNSIRGIIEKAHALNVDVYVSGDIKDSTARYATELGIAIIDAGHYATETPGMKALSEKLKCRFKELDVIFLDIGKPWKFL
jgi:dinuclear metal center YbgI/SA1388 family protein